MAEFLKSLIGKTIVNVIDLIEETNDGDPAIILEFSDGTTAEIGLNMDDIDLYGEWVRLKDSAREFRVIKD